MLYLVAAESGEKPPNFLVPNGTFFVCLAIFVIVLIVIRTMVAPQIVKVLDERESMVAKTTEDNKSAAASYEDADAQYQAAMKVARGDATGIRDQARAQGNEQLAAAKKRATDEADAALATTTAQLRSEGELAAESARAEVKRLSETLASRVLGTEVSANQEKVN